MTACIQIGLTVDSLFKISQLNYVTIIKVVLSGLMWKKAESGLGIKEETAEDHGVIKGIKWSKDLFFPMIPGIFILPWIIDLHFSWKAPELIMLQL